MERSRIPGGPLELLVDRDGHSEPVLLADSEGGFLLGYGNRVLRYR